MYNYFLVVHLVCIKPLVLPTKAEAFEKSGRKIVVVYLFHSPAN